MQIYIALPYYKEQKHSRKLCEIQTQIKIVNHKTYFIEKFAFFDLRLIEKITSDMKKKIEDNYIQCSFSRYLRRKLKMAPFS